MIPVIAGMAAASALASIYGASKSADAATSAANTAAAQEQRGLDFQKQVYSENKANLTPWVTAGKDALNTYQGQLANAKQPEFNYKQPEFNFSTYTDPSAQYMMAQATKALQGSALARGASGGGFAKALSEKNQEMANTAYAGAWDRYKDKTKIDYGQETDKYNRNNDWMNKLYDRYGNLASNGQSAAAGQASSSNQLASGVANSYNSMGQSLASGTLGAAGAWNQGLTGVTNALSNGLGAGVAAYNAGTPNTNLPQGVQDSSITRTNLGTGVA